MAKINDIPDRVLASSLTTIEIPASSETDVTIVVDNKQCLKENYVPTNGVVTLYDVDKLLLPYFSTKPFRQKINVTVHSSALAAPKAFFAFYATVAVPVDAVQFFTNYFLTTLVLGDKTTFPHSKEQLYIYAYGEAAPVTADAVWVDSKGRRSTNRYSLGTIAAGSTGSVNTSPSRFASSGKRLVKVTVTAGGRSIIYNVSQSCSPEDDVQFYFRNAFGVMEYFMLTGVRTVKPEFQRQSAYMGGVLHTYNVDEERIFEASTGYIPESMHELADDLARSPEVYVVQNGQNIPVTITDSKTDRSNDLAGMFSMSVKYRPSSRVQAHLTLPPEIFDDSFDDTFN